MRISPPHSLENCIAITETVEKGKDGNASPSPIQTAQHTLAQNKNKGKACKQLLLY